MWTKKEKEVTQQSDFLKIMFGWLCLFGSITDCKTHSMPFEAGIFLHILGVLHQTAYILL
jgi:hypothetical protein